MNLVLTDDTNTRSGTEEKDLARLSSMLTIKRERPGADRVVLENMLSHNDTLKDESATAGCDLDRPKILHAKLY